VEFGSWLQTFRENTSIVFSRIKQTAWPLTMGWPEMICHVNQSYYVYHVEVTTSWSEVTVV
jgi:hypothetical protein